MRFVKTVNINFADNLPTFPITKSLWSYLKLLLICLLELGFGFDQSLLWGKPVGKSPYYRSIDRSANWRVKDSIETPQIRLPPAVNKSHQNIRGVHSEHTQNFIYPSLKCKWPIHTKLLAPNDLISLSYRTQYCVRNDNVYYELKKKIRLKYLSATRPVLEDFLGFLKVSLSRHNDGCSELTVTVVENSNSRVGCNPNKMVTSLNWACASAFAYSIGLRNVSITPSNYPRQITFYVCRS